MLRLLLGLLIPAMLLGTALRAGAFTVNVGFVHCEDGYQCYGDAGDVADARTTPEKAPRWNADPTAYPTLADGIQVAVEPGFGAALAAIMPPSAAEYEAALGGVQDCAIAAARCRACLLVNALDDLSLDRDRVDDQTVNLSCPPSLP